MVYDKLLKIEGFFQRVKGKNVEYLCKGKRLIAPIDRLIVTTLEQKTKTRAKKSPIETKYIEKCDIRGEFTEDAAQIVEKALDTAYAGGAHSLSIVHGMGSGKLKKFIRDFLNEYQKRYNYTFNAGNNEEGGDSVTVVKFNQ